MWRRRGGRKWRHGLGPRAEWSARTSGYKSPRRVARNRDLRVPAQIYRLDLEQNVDTFILILVHTISHFSSPPCPPQSASLWLRHVRSTLLVLSRDPQQALLPFSRRLRKTSKRPRNGSSRRPRKVQRSSSSQSTSCKVSWMAEK